MSDNEEKTVQRKGPSRRVSISPPIIVVHAEPNIGKTTWASTAPNPIFMFTENGQRDLELAVMGDKDYITSYAEFMEHLTTVAILRKKGELNDEHDNPYETLVIDSLDHLEKLVYDGVAHEFRDNHMVKDNFTEDQRRKVKTFADIPPKYNFDKWNMIFSKWSRIMDGIAAIRSMGMAIIGVCHSLDKGVSDTVSEVEYEKRMLHLHPKYSQPYWVDNADLIGYMHYPLVSNEETGKTAQATTPVITFKRTHLALTKQNFGSTEYKVALPKDGSEYQGFLKSVGEFHPFYKAKVAALAKAEAAKSEKSKKGKDK